MIKTKKKIKTFLWMEKDKYLTGKKEVFIYPDKNSNNELDKYLLEKLNTKYNKEYESVYNILQFSEFGKTYNFVNYMELLSKYMMTYKNRNHMFFDNNYLLLEMNIPIEELIYNVYDYHQYNKIIDLMDNGNELKDAIQISLDEKYPLYMYIQLGLMILPYIKSSWVGIVRNLSEVQTEVHHNMHINPYVRLFLEQKLNILLKNKYYDSHYYDRFLSGYYDGRGASYSYIMERPADETSVVEKII